ncbi:MAG: sulfatase [Pirellulaceae bacterium]|nr:sulfatase [Pirellulaceae bacterium]
MKPFCWTPLLAGFLIVTTAEATLAVDRPNILLAIADDWCYPHASAYDCKFVRTPAFDRVAREGVLFQNAFTATPGCSPSRAALLTGQHSWRLREAGTHASSFPRDLPVYPQILEQAGYFVGYSGKAWGPGNFKISGWERNPAGTDFSVKLDNPPNKGIGPTDYAASFAKFLKTRPKDQPFCFWYGGKEPHRAYEKGAGLAAGKKLADVEVPPFLPASDEVRSDLLDYAMEVEYFDAQLGKLLDQLAATGEAENTLVIVCSDNGMPFPRAKANLYDHGTHMPLAIRWPAKVKGNRTVSDFAGHVDLAPTILAASGENIPAATTGKSLLPTLISDKSGQVDPTRDHVFLARERHSSSRPMNLGYPARAIRTADYLYIRNFKPDQWPAGDPATAAGTSGYHDIDASPTLALLVAGKDDPKIRPFLDLAVAKRPAEELFSLKDDPATVRNVATEPLHAAAKAKLRGQLDDNLTKTGDARMTPDGDVWETYKRYSPIREF